MSLTIWNLLTDLYDHNALADNFISVGAHDHSNGKGVQIGTAGIANGAITAAQIANGTVTSSLLASGVATVPSGVVMDFAGTNAPSGFLLCDGTAYSSSTYPTLFAEIGTAWNTGGEASGYFRVPDFRGRVAVGSGTGSGLTARTLGPGSAQVANSGVTGGEESHILASAESGTNGAGTTSTDSPQHSHGFSGNNVPASADAWTPTDVLPNSGTGSVLIGYVGADVANITATSVENQSHTHTLNAANANNSHNNMQPFAVATKIIKT